MATTRKVQRRIGMRHGGPAMIAIGAVIVLFGALDTTTAGPAAGSEAPPNEKKVYVCKYVGTPYVDERLQTGDNPIWVSENAIPDPEGDGVHIDDEFADKQGRSIVIQIGGEDPGIGACPAALIPTTTTAPPNPTVPQTTTMEPGATTTTVDQLGPATGTTTTTTTTVPAAVTTAQVGSEGPTLPGTGGPSRTLIAIGAIVMAAGAGLTLVGRNRRRMTV